MHSSDLRFDTIEIRHLVFAYAVVFLVQGGYFAWLAVRWRKMNRG
jgi:hypothetical protein